MPEMSKNAVLDSSVADRVQEKLDLGTELEAGGKLKQAEENYLAAWELLPTPRYRWDYSLYVTSSITDFYLASGNIAEAKRWLKEVQQCYIPTRDTAPDILAGKVYFEAGELDKAREFFQKAFLQGNKRAFLNEDPKYLRFLNKKS